jgi:hypothetical protein
MFVNAIGQPHGIIATWSDIQYTAGPTPAEGSTWGRIKSQYR